MILIQGYIMFHVYNWGPFPPHPPTPNAHPNPPHPLCLRLSCINPSILCSVCNCMPPMILWDVKHVHGVSSIVKIPLQGKHNGHGVHTQYWKCIVHKILTSVGQIIFSWILFWYMIYNFYLKLLWCVRYGTYGWYDALIISNPWNYTIHLLLRNNSHE